MPPLAERPGSLGYAEHRRYDVIATCEACGYRTAMNLGKLLNNFGHRTLLSDLEKKLRCTRCRARRARLTSSAKTRICPTCGQAAPMIRR
jgi:transcription elongation factor Elf1